MRPSLSPLLLSLIAAPLLSGETLSSAERFELVDGVAALVRENYVEPETAEKVAARLKELAAGDDLDPAWSPADLAGALTRELEPFDRHFRVDWSSPAGSPSSGGGFHDEEGEARWRHWSRLHNHGFHQVENLAGNIGYLDLRYFDELSGARNVAAAAMAFLADADAVIVDLRDNGGGEPKMVQFLVSHFFAGGGVLYNSFYSRSTDRLQEFRTLEEVPGRRLPDTPLLVLTSPRTGSAAESFAYSLQALGRATVVGERTAGAANPGEVFEIGNGFSIFISTGKPINPVTGANWERTGVQPDVDVAATDALDVARERLLALLLEQPADPVRRRLQTWAAEALGAGRRPIALESELLERYAGIYGERRITLANGRLHYQRGRRTRRAMVPLADDLFHLDGVDGFRTRFESDASGRVIRLVDMWSDGHEESSLRD